MIIDVERKSINVFDESIGSLIVFTGDLSEATTDMLRYYGNLLKGSYVDILGYGGYVYDIMEKIDLDPKILNVKRFK
mgnify:CR=1 FL=1